MTFLHFEGRRARRERRNNLAPPPGPAFGEAPSPVPTDRADLSPRRGCFFAWARERGRATGLLFPRESMPCIQREGAENNYNLSEGRG